MAQQTLNITMDENLIHQLDSFCDDVGMTIDVVFNVFAKKVVNNWCIPFTIGVDEDTPNEETIAAMREVDEMIRSGHQPRFSSAEEMFKDMGIDVTG